MTKNWCLVFNRQRCLGPSLYGRSGTRVDPDLAIVDPDLGSLCSSGSIWEKIEAVTDLLQLVSDTIIDPDLHM